jgi:hypothetical protein
MNDMNVYGGMTGGNLWEAGGKERILMSKGDRSTTEREREREERDRDHNTTYYTFRGEEGNVEWNTMEGVNLYNVNCTLVSNYQDEIPLT